MYKTTTGFKLPPKAKREQVLVTPQCLYPGGDGASTPR
jgi:hypothetical protein